MMLMERKIFDSFRKRIDSKRDSKSLLWKSLALLKDLCGRVRFFTRLLFIIKLSRIVRIHLPLEGYRLKLYNSHCGEDGIIDEIVRRLGIKDGLFVEFGANDGILLCNTSGLVKMGWRGIYIESNPPRFKELIDNMKNCKKITCICKKISAEPGDTINDALSKTDIPKEFDLVSIDIDSNDYWIWKSMEYTPKIVVIEYNRNLYPHESKAIRYDPKFVYDNTAYYGSSARALYKLGQSKGYTLVANTKENLFFIKDEYVKNRFKPLDVNKIARVKTHAPASKDFIEV